MEADGDLTNKYMLAHMQARITQEHTWAAVAQTQDFIKLTCTQANAVRSALQDAAVSI